MDRKEDEALFSPILCKRGGPHGREDFSLRVFLRDERGGTVFFPPPPQLAFLVSLPSLLHEHESFFLSSLYLSSPSPKYSVVDYDNWDFLFPPESPFFQNPLFLSSFTASDRE